MSCIETQAELPLFVGGDLESPGRERVARHLESCVPCRELLARAEAARGLRAEEFQRTAERPTPSGWAEMRGRLLAEGLIQSSPGEGSVPAARSRPAGKLLRFARPAAAAAVLFLAGTWTGSWLLNSGGGGVSSPADTAPAGPGPALVVDDGGPSGGPLEPTPVAEVERRGEPLREIDGEGSFSERARSYGQSVVPFHTFGTPLAGQGSPASYSQPGANGPSNRDGWR